MKYEKKGASGKDLGSFLVEGNKKRRGRKEGGS